MAKLPKHWKSASWEQMAREDPLYAVMTCEEMVGAGPGGLTPERLESFFAKGRKIYDTRIKHLMPHAPDPPHEALVLDYGCGMGRVMRAVADAGHRCAGVDISPTMLEHCRRLAPEAEALAQVQEDGRVPLPDGCASVVFSFAVVQHIASLRLYLAAFEEMCRMLKPGGLLTVHLNCTDFEGGDMESPGRTENFEDHSLHYRPGEDEPYLRHEHNQWSGVYIGHRRLKKHLRTNGMQVLRFRYHNMAKPAGVWVTAYKTPPQPLED